MIGPLVLIVCLALLVLSMRSALARRRDFAGVRGGPLYGPAARGRTPGSSASIADAGRVPAQELLDALKLPNAAEVNGDGEDDGASGLGLRLHAGGSPTNGLPQVMEGVRNGRQTFVRQGLVGTSLSPGLGLRRSRDITVVRVLAPAFEATLDAGRIVADAAASPVAREFLAGLAPSPDVWHDGRLVSGAEGIVVSRGAASDWLGGWSYDLWLLERLADLLNAPNLSPVRLDRWWEAPYGLHDWSPGLLDTAKARRIRLTTATDGSRGAHDHV